MKVEWNSYQSPLGPLVLVESPAGPLVVEYAQRAALPETDDLLRRRFPGLEPALGPCRATSGWLDAYFGGQPLGFPYPEYLERYLRVTPAAAAVWRAMCDIPFGETRTYQALGRATGLHARLVGRMAGANHLAILIPCHRVVGSRGDLVGYGGGIGRKRRLLAHELRSSGVLLR